MPLAWTIPLLVAAGVLSVGASVLAGVALIAQQKFRRRMDAFLAGKDGKSLEGVLREHGTTLAAHREQLADVLKASEYLHRAVQDSLRKVAFERYNPFPDAGGNQSFTLVLLDAHNSGVVITSLHNREATRVYAKAIRTGKPLQTLSGEEERVLKNALLLKGV